MNISQTGIHLIKYWEGFRGQLYQDANGNWTIGFGHLCNPLEVVRYRKGITQEQAEWIMKKDLAVVLKQLEPLNLNQNQFDALCSFIYNKGQGNFRRSDLLKHIQQKNFVAAGEEFLNKKWSQAKNGKVLVGLLLRRKAERALFVKPMK